MTEFLVKYGSGAGLGIL